MSKDLKISKDFKDWERGEKLEANNEKKTTKDTEEKTKEYVIRGDRRENFHKERDRENF